MNPVVSGARLFAQHRDFGVLHARFSQAFQEFVADHAMTNDDDFHVNSEQGNQVRAVFAD